MKGAWLLAAPLIGAAMVVLISSVEDGRRRIEDSRYAVDHNCSRYGAGGACFVYGWDLGDDPWPVRDWKTHCTGVEYAPPHECDSHTDTRHFHKFFGSK